MLIIDYFLEKIYGKSKFMGSITPPYPSGEIYNLGDNISLAD